MIRVPTHRPPTHPGEMLVEEFLAPMGINESELAEFIQYLLPHQRNYHQPKERYTQHRPAFGKVFWHVRRLLDESAIALGLVPHPTSRV